MLKESPSYAGLASIAVIVKRFSYITRGRFLYIESDPQLWPDFDKLYYYMIICICYSYYLKVVVSWKLSLGHLFILKLYCLNGYKKIILAEDEEGSAVGLAPQNKNKKQTKINRLR